MFYEQQSDLKQHQAAMLVSPGQMSCDGGLTRTLSSSQMLPGLAVRLHPDVVAPLHPRFLLSGGGALEAQTTEGLCVLPCSAVTMATVSSRFTCMTPACSEAPLGYFQLKANRTDTTASWRRGSQSLCKDSVQRFSSEIQFSDSFQRFNPLAAVVLVNPVTD